MNKIVHMTSVHVRNDTRIFYKECVSLANAGYEVVLIVADGKGDEEKNGVTIVDVGKKPTSRIRRMIFTTARIYKAAWQIDADVYHFHDPELLPVGWLLQRKGKKVIYDVHEDVRLQILNKYWIPNMLRKTVSKIAGFVEDCFSKRFEACVCATKSISQRFQGIAKKTVVVNNYPISAELFAPDLSWEKKERAVCYVGGITRSRGIRELLEAITKTEAHLILAGAFQSKAEYEEARKKPGWDKTQALGFVGRSEVAEVLKRSMAGIVTFHPMPNHINAQPNKMFEYMSAGLPVIASHFPLWKEIVEGHKCGICVDPLSPEEISEAINWILDHPAEAAEMGKRGRAAVLDKYSWEREEQKLLKLYRALEGDTESF
jgi:hypothetical protein